MDSEKQDRVLSPHNAEEGDCREELCIGGKDPIVAAREEQGGLFSMLSGGDGIKVTALPRKGVGVDVKMEEAHVTCIDPNIQSGEVKAPISQGEKGGKCGQKYGGSPPHAGAQTSKDGPNVVSEVTLEAGYQQEGEKHPAKEKKKVGRPRKKELKVTTKKLLPRPAAMYQDYAHLYAKTSVASTWAQPEQADSKTVQSPTASTPTGAHVAVEMLEEDKSNGESLNIEQKKGRKADGSSKQPRKRVAGPGPSNWQGPPIYHGMPYPFMQQGPYTPSIHAPFPPFFSPIVPPSVASGPSFHMPLPLQQPVPSGNVQLHPPSQHYQAIPPPPHMMPYPYLHRPFQGSTTVGSPTYTDLFQLQQVSSFFAELVPNLCNVCQATAVQLAPPPYQAVFFNRGKQNGALSPNERQPAKFSQSDIAGATEVGVMVHAPREFLSKKVKKDESVSPSPSLKEHVYYLPADGDGNVGQQKIKGGKRKRPVIYIKWQAFEQLGRHAVDLDIHVKDGLRLKNLKKRKVEMQEALREQGQEIKRLKCEIATRDEKIQKLIMGCGRPVHAELGKQKVPEDQNMKTQQDVLYSLGKSTSSFSCRVCGGKVMGKSVADPTAAVGLQERCLCRTHAGSSANDKVTQQGLGSEGVAPQTVVLKAPKPMYSSSSPKLSRTDKQRKYNTMVKDMLKRQQYVSNGIVVFEACPAVKSQARGALDEVDTAAPIHDADIIPDGHLSTEETYVPLESGASSLRSGSCEPNASVTHGSLQRQTSGLPRLSLQLPYDHGEEGCVLSRSVQDVQTERHQYGQISGQADQSQRLHKFQWGDGPKGHHFFVEQSQHLQQQQSRYQLNQPSLTQRPVEVRKHQFDQQLVQEERHTERGGGVMDRNEVAPVQLHRSRTKQMSRGHQELRKQQRHVALESQQKSQPSSGEFTPKK